VFFFLLFDSLALDLDSIFVFLFHLLLFLLRPEFLFVEIWITDGEKTVRSFVDGDDDEILGGNYMIKRTLHG
jgi:hypothetical protein